MARAQALDLPVPGAMITSAPALMPLMMKGVRVHTDNPLVFDFIMDTGTSGLETDGQAFRAESAKLIKYFLASLAIKEKNMWVNLSPFEKDRVIADDLGKTVLGRDMLAQDYVLKQLTASLLYPEKELGREFWAKVYTQAQEKFGTTDIPVDTFHKVWITGDKARVLERNDVGYVVGMHLKVMLESDYMAGTKAPAADGQGLAKQIMREIIIPQIEKEVNEGAHFAPLRQIFSAMILAAWYKKALKETLLNQVYSDQGKTGGIESHDPAMKQKIYARYLEAYQKGVFNYIKEETDQVTGQVVPRKYFSGGVVPGKFADPDVSGDVVEGDDTSVTGSMLEVTTRMEQADTVSIDELEKKLEIWSFVQIGSVLSAGWSLWAMFVSNFMPPDYYSVTFDVVAISAGAAYLLALWQKDALERKIRLEKSLDRTKDASEKTRPVILYIDDMETDRYLLKRKITRLFPDFEVMDMDYEEGMDHIRAHGVSIAGVITDTENSNASGLRGLDIVRETRKLFPAMPMRGISNSEDPQIPLDYQGEGVAFVSKQDMDAELPQILSEFKSSWDARPDDAEYPDLRRWPLFERLDDIAEVRQTGKGGYTRTELTVQEYVWWQVAIAQSLAYAWNKAKGNETIDIDKVRFLGTAKELSRFPFDSYFKQGKDWERTLKNAGVDTRGLAIDVLKKEGVKLDVALEADLRALGDREQSVGTGISDEAKLVLTAQYWSNIIKRIFVGMDNRRLNITVNDAGKLQYPRDFDAVDFPKALIFILAKVGREVGNVSSWDHGLFDPVVDTAVESIFKRSSSIDDALAKAKNISEMIEGLVPQADNSGPEAEAQIYGDRMTQSCERILTDLIAQKTGAVADPVSAAVREVIQYTEADVLKLHKQNDRDNGPLDGGIDLDMQKTQMDVVTEGRGLAMTFDPAMAERFRQENFTGVMPVILKVTPVQGPLQLLGLAG